MDTAEAALALVGRPRFQPDLGLGKRSHAGFSTREPRREAETGVLNHRGNFIFTKGNEVNEGRRPNDLCFASFPWMP